MPTDQLAPEPQAICNPITSSAIFIVATLLPGIDAASQVRGWCGDIAALTRSVGKRVPNGNLSNGIITNTNRQPTRKVVFDVGVDYDADLHKARNVLLELAQDPRVLADPAPQAVISTLGDSSITVSLRIWTKTSDYWDVMFHFNEHARDRLKEAGIDIPFPQRVIRVVQETA